MGRTLNIVNTHTLRLNALEIYQGQSDARITQNHNNINANFIRICDVTQRVTNLEGRATAVEGRATNLEGRATAVENRATTVENRTTAVEGRATTVEGRTTAVEGRSTALEARLNPEGGACVIGLMQNRLGLVEAKTNASENSVTALSNRVNEIDVLKEQLATTKAENISLRHMVEFLDRHQKLEDRKIKHIEEKFEMLMQQQISELKAAWKKDRAGLTQQIEVYAEQMRKQNLKIEALAETASVRHSELAKQNSDLREKQTKYQARNSSLNMRNRRNSWAFPSSATELQKAINTEGDQ